MATFSVKIVSKDSEPIWLRLNNMDDDLDALEQARKYMQMKKIKGYVEEMYLLMYKDERKENKKWR